MSISGDAPEAVIHPLPVSEVCPYEYCRPGAVSSCEAPQLEALRPCLHNGYHQPGQCPETNALPASPYPTLETPVVATGMRCPSVEALEELVAGRRRLGWVPEFDAIEASAAAALACGACGGRLCYLALAPVPGAPATAWAICVTCRHWVQL